MPPAGDRSLSEVRAEVSKLTDEDIERWRRIARYQLFRFPQLDPLDLVAETAARFLEGRRTWPNSVSWETVFYNALRSVADEFRDGEMSKPIVTAADLARDDTDDACPLDQLGSDSRTPEKAV